MRLTKAMIVVCHDNNKYIIGERTKDNYIVGEKIIPYNGGEVTCRSQRLFKPDGKYAGGDKSKNISRVL